MNQIVRRSLMAQNEGHDVLIEDTKVFFVSLKKFEEYFCLNFISFTSNCNVSENALPFPSEKI